MSSSAQSLSQMGIDLNRVVAEFKTSDERRVVVSDAPTPTYRRSRRATPIVERLAEARERMKMRRPDNLAVESVEDDLNGEAVEPEEQAEQV